MYICFFQKAYIKVFYHRKHSTVDGFANSRKCPFSFDLKLVKTDHPWPKWRSYAILAGFELGDWVVMHSYRTVISSNTSAHFSFCCPCFQVPSTTHWMIIFSKFSPSHLLPGGVLKFGLGRDVPPWNLKVDPYKYKFFKKKWPIHIPIGSIFGQILSKITRFFQNFLKFEPILAQISEFLKNQPIHIPNFTFYKGSFIYQEADFATHVSGTSP